MKRPGQVLGLAAAGCLLGAALQFTVELPPALLTGLASMASDGLIRLHAPEGGLFGGQARVALARSGTELDFGRWTWSVAWTATGGPGWTLVAESGPLRGQLHVAPGPGHTDLGEVHLQIPAQAVPPGFASWDFLHAGGVLDLSSSALRLDAQGLVGKGRLQWRDASTTLVAVAPLGSWTASFDAQGKEGDYRLDTLGGPLHLEGQGRFALDGRLGLEGRAWPDPAQADALNPVLGMLGTPREDGSVSLTLPWTQAK